MGTCVRARGSGSGIHRAVSLEIKSQPEIGHVGFDFISLRGRDIAKKGRALFLKRKFEGIFESDTEVNGNVFDFIDEGRARDVGFCPSVKGHAQVGIDMEELACRCHAKASDERAAVFEGNSLVFRQFETIEVDAVPYELRLRCEEKAFEAEVVSDFLCHAPRVRIVSGREGSVFGMQAAVKVCVSNLRIGVESVVLPQRTEGSREVAGFDVSFTGCRGKFGFRRSYHDVRAEVERLRNGDVDAETYA